MNITNNAEGYYSMKPRFPDSLVLCQNGLFYETYGGKPGEDAEIVSYTLGIIFTVCYVPVLGHSVCMCRFPLCELEENLIRLTAKGYDVVLSKQDADQNAITLIPAAPTAKAKRLINEYRKDTFDVLADFSDMSNVALGVSSTGDGKYSIEVSADLVNLRLTYQVDGEIVALVQYHDMVEMNERLANLDFNEMIAFAENEWTKPKKKDNQNVVLKDGIEVETPLGTIIVEAKGGIDDYPGIWVSFLHKGADVNDLVACIEHDTEQDHIQTVLYEADRDEPTQIVKFTN